MRRIRINFTYGPAIRKPKDEVLEAQEGPDGVFRVDLEQEGAIDENFSLRDEEREELINEEIQKLFNFPPQYK